MKNKSIRIRTTPGVDKNIFVELKQDFDFLEILSLKISQDDLYTSFCANYGVVVGRVIANNGFGVPNAKVSIFIPITDEDERNDLIKTLYPYKTPISKDENGYRYNLFLKDETCNIVTPIGTFPSKEEVLNNDIQLEIFEKYYKFTTKTNGAGDYIMFGIPTGEQIVHMDVDFSDIGALSLKPYDLIEQGYGEEMFDGRNKFKASTNLDVLPQVKTQNKGINVVPFWGDKDLCEYGITRVDFDTGIDLAPSAVFIGSIFTDIGKNSLDKRCNPKNDMGRQCELRTGQGVIDILRVIYEDGDPDRPQRIEEFTPQRGRVTIDEDGTFVTPLPMYYGRVVTDEFGNVVSSLDPSKGIPTKGKYRFKLKFSEAPIVKDRATASLIVPSVDRSKGGTYGTEQQRWTTGSVEDIYNNPGTGGYGNQIFGIQSPSPYNSLMLSDLDLDFHTFEWKQVYTLSQFIKKYKKGGSRFSFVGLKSIDECGENNSFPFTTAVKKSSFQLGLFKIIIDLIYSFWYFLILMKNIKFCAYFRLGLGSKCREILSFRPFGFIPPNNPVVLSEGSVCEATLDPDCGDKECACNAPDVLDVDGTGCCCPDSNGDCDCTNDFCFTFTVIPPTQANCPTLVNLEQWACCAKYELARALNAIQFSFFDAWLNGSAYLFQFKIKERIKGDGSIKQKFCGPGSDNTGGNNYSAICSAYFNPAGKCPEDRCTVGQCLILGPSDDTDDRNYVGGTNQVTYPLSTPGLPNGANDSGEFLYCNWISGTRIISLGRMEMCGDALIDIEKCIAQQNIGLECNINDLILGDGNNPINVATNTQPFYTGPQSQYIIPFDNYYNSPSYNAPQVIKVGTGGETGFDRQEQNKSLPETSFEDPGVVVKHYLTTIGCDYNKLFLSSSDLGGAACHEKELVEDAERLVRQVSKVHNEVVTVPPLINNPPSGPQDFDDDSPPVWDVMGYAPIYDPGPPAAIPGPFAVDPLLYARYHPNQDDFTFTIGGVGAYTPENSAYNAWSHIDNKTNMPYFYFGLKPGKTAIDKFRELYVADI